MKILTAILIGLAITTFIYGVVYVFYILFLNWEVGLSVVTVILTAYFASVYYKQIDE